MTTSLALSIREITSVSVTFTLASTLNGEPDLTLTSLGLVPDDDPEDLDDDDDLFIENKKHTILSDALANGFSISVNGIPWQRVLIRIDDKTDEAVIIIYGLMPGRQYDVELDLVQGGQNSSIRKHVITEDSSKTITGQENTREPPLALTESLPPMSPTRSMPSTSQCDSASSGTPLTIEDRLQQLQADLALVNTDRDNLVASLKSSRRDAQKADAALRSEIDVLRRASEKHTAAEHRARQKILALQEAIKRAQAATREVEGLVRDVEAALPAFRQKQSEKEMEYTRIKEEAEQARRERDKEAEKDKKQVEVINGELTALCNKLDKLNLKKEKLESSVISDLNEQLKEIGREMQQIEADSGEESLGDLIEASMFGFSETGPPHSPLPVQRQRHHSQHSLGAIARPAIAPIQRPSIASASPPQSWSLNRTTGTIIQNSRPQPPHSPTFKAGPIAAPTTTPASVSMSTLSSWAPAFEPSARSTQSPSSAVEPSYSVPIRRPRQSFSNTSRPVRGPVNTK